MTESPEKDVAPLAVLSDVRVRRGRTEVVHGVDLTVARGEVVALLGPNGAGKSTLLETVGGLVKPSAGTVRVTGEVASVLQAPGLARRSVRANVELALAWWGVPRGQRRPRAMEALELMRAAHLARRPAGSLSGGERRRVHVARGVALRPDLLLLDEPFAGLDPETRALLCEDTASALRTSAGGVVVVVHDRAEAWAMADRLVVVMDGRVAAEGRPADVLAAPPTADVARFLGYDGEVATDGGRVLTRPVHVRVRPDGEHAGTVTRVVPLQDGVQVEIEVAHGRLRAHHPEPDLRVGDGVRVSVIGGVRFPDGDPALPSPHGGLPADR